MIFGDLDFDAAFDVCEVDQIGYVDLRMAYETHTIPGNLNPEDLSYNEIEDPASITGKPSDIFEAVQAGHKYASFLEGQSSEEDKSK